MNILVTAASKHGATAEIASAIAETLRSQRIEVTHLEPDKVLDVRAYDAAVIGSAVYAGRWLEPARALVERHAETLSTIPVWLFSSGPLGDPLRPEGDPVEAGAMVAATAAREHRVFGGRLERTRLGFAEKAIVVALRAPDGDFRDWEEIDGWAEEIAASLSPSEPRP